MTSTFTDVHHGDPVSPADLAETCAALGRLLARPGPFVLPPALVTMLVEGVVACARLVDGVVTEFGWLGPDMAGYYESYEFALYQPLAVPIALDGGGGFFSLDARGPRADGGEAVVWSHAGSLGWEPDDHRVVAADFTALLADPRAV